LEGTNSSEGIHKEDIEDKKCKSDFQKIPSSILVDFVPKTVLLCRINVHERKPK
jgi:hypothetical protein